MNMVPRRGFEPLKTGPEPAGLSISLTGHYLFENYECYL